MSIKTELILTVHAPSLAALGDSTTDFCRSSDRLLYILGGGSRLDILRVLVESPKTVSAVAAAVFLRMNMVSHELGILKKCGLVRCAQEGTTHTYSVTDRVRSFGRGEMQQIVVRNDAGDWIVIHFDDSGDESRAIMPPDRFVNSARSLESN